jgi:AAA+ ATPase superfamily predicted ATPase
MKFYNRNRELEDIKNILNKKESDFIYIYWRRRIWKTKLLLKALEWKKFLYFFVWEKTKQELLNDFVKIIEWVLWIWYLKFDNFRDFLDFLFDYSKKEDLIIVFDEFQNFHNFDKWIFSDFQYFWDLNKDYSNIKLFCLGSHFKLMRDIFENYSNPLFWRKTASFYLKSFEVDTQIEILKDYNKLSAKNLLYIFSIFYWIPKYLEIFLKEIDNKKDILDNILDIFIRENSFFIFEWKELFSLEFWKSYEKYSSILTAISIWKTKKTEISDFTWISNDSLWVYLKKLETYYELIERNILITEKKSSKNSKYMVKDLFLKFWFRYIHKYGYMIEMRNLEWLKDFIKIDIDIFLWIAFEDLTKKIVISENIKNKLPFKIEKIGYFFDKKGQNEIDLVCISSKEKKVLFIECKINSKNINSPQLNRLKQKVKDSWIYYSYKKYYWFSTLGKTEIKCDYLLELESYI